MCIYIFLDLLVFHSRELWPIAHTKIKTPEKFMTNITFKHLKYSVKILVAITINKA